jgi:hypothetical protein
MENKLLTVCDKMSNFGGCYKTNDKLKSLITQSEQNIKLKGINTVTIHDYNNYIMQSNNQWSVCIEASDCWYVVIGCSEQLNKVVVDFVFGFGVLYERVGTSVPDKSSTVHIS